MNGFFKPRHIRLGEQRITLFDGKKSTCRVVVDESADPLMLEAARIVREAVKCPEAGVASISDPLSKQVGVYLCTPQNPTRYGRLFGESRLRETRINQDQAFEILTVGHDIVVLGQTSRGVIYGARALADLVQSDSDRLWIPEVEAYDYPDMAYRGLYVECRWGPDSMTLEQWKQAIDELAGMRFNVIGIGLHNNWPIQYDGLVSEWMMVPIKKYPKLKTPKLVNYYSPALKKDIRLEYLPRIYEEDLFGEIIKYARSKGVIVRPHFNTPGHNTQIPRHYPETSAKYPDGKPKNYGFCMSSPATYEVMFGIFDEICDKYLLPNGIDWFHIGLDEVYPMVGMNPETPLLRIDPWCECPECSEVSPEDRFVNYAVKLAKHLKEKGINNIGMWHDHFARGGKLNEELAKRFESEGLKDAVVLHWWRYSDFFDTTHPEMGLRRWVVPMTGYFCWINYTDHQHNIFWAIDKGVEEKAEGVESYGVWHPSFHQHFMMLGTKSWNSGRWQSPAQVREEYAKLLFGERWKRGLRGLSYFDNATGGGGMMNWVCRLFSYPYLYANWKEDAYVRENYPQVIIEQLIANSLNVLGFLGQVGSEVQKAMAIFEELKDYALPENARIISLYIIECQRIKAVIDLFTQVTSAVRLARSQASPEKIMQAAGAVEQCVSQLEKAMLSIEQSWEAPFVPQALRELTLMRRFALELVSELRGQPSGELNVMRCKQVDWPND